jgi:hypothetical protein
MNRIFNLQSPFRNSNNNSNNNNQNNQQPLRRLLSPQPSFADESLYYEEDIMIFPATSLLPTKQQDLAPKQPLVRTKSCDSFSTITTAEETPGESSCGIKKRPVLSRLPSSVLANVLLPLEISFPNKPLPPMPRQLMEKARPIPEPKMEEEDYFEDDDDDDDDDDYQMEIVFLPDDHLPPPATVTTTSTSTATATTAVPPPLHGHSRTMESDPQPEEPCRDRSALWRGPPPSIRLQQDLRVPARSFDLRVPARSFEPYRTLPSSAGQVLVQQRDLIVPARSFEPKLLLGDTRFEI